MTAPAKKPAPPPKKPAPPPPKPAPKPTTLDQTQQSIYDLMAETLASWGLSSLLADVKDLILKGDTSPDTLSLALSQTQAYKTRFAANAIRDKNNLPELTPAQYIALEEQYSNVMRSYGLPKGFYDSPTDFTNLIAGDVSAQELQSRVQVYHDEYQNAPASTKALWGQYYGKGDILASLIDPNVATSLIQDRGQQIGIGAAAIAQGLHIDQQRAQQLQQGGVTLTGALRAYQQIAQSLPFDQSIAKRFGTTFDQSQEENDLLLNQGAATQKRATLYGEEEGLFHGHAGADTNTFGVSQSY